MHPLRVISPPLGQGFHASPQIAFHMIESDAAQPKADEAHCHQSAHEIEKEF